MLRAEPRGTCFAHGPYENADGSIGCPKRPDCATDPQQDAFIALAQRISRKSALLRAAGVLEKENLLPNIVATLRQESESY